MTFEGLGEMFEGDSADTDARKISAHVDGGLSRGSGSKDQTCKEGWNLGT